jgi:hypothetical protein
MGVAYPQALVGCTLKARRQPPQPSWPTSWSATSATVEGKAVLDNLRVSALTAVQVTLGVAGSRPQARRLVRDAGL